MAINTLQYALILQKALDQKAVQELTSGWMELNSNLVQYSGGNEIKIPSMVVEGLADYDRDTGYAQGGVTLTWETYKMTQDRGRKFQLDAMDVDETAFIATANSVMNEFQSAHVIPEIDAYRYSKIAQIVDADGNAANQTTTEILTPQSVFEAMVRDLAAIEDRIGTQQIVITMTSTIQGLLQIAVKEHISSATFKQGGIDLTVPAFNSVPIIKVASNRLVSKLDILSGKGNAGGFKKAADAKDINWIVSAKNAPIAVTKQDKMRIFTPDQNQDADAWKMNYRRYHELWVPKNKVAGIQISYAGAGDGTRMMKQNAPVDLDVIKKEMYEAARNELFQEQQQAKLEQEAKEKELDAKQAEFMATTNELLQAELNKRGIAFDAKANKETLVALLMEDEKAALNE